MYHYSSCSLNYTSIRGSRCLCLAVGAVVLDALFRFPLARRLEVHVCPYTYALETARSARHRRKNFSNDIVHVYSSAHYLKSI